MINRDADILVEVDGEMQSVEIHPEEQKAIFIPKKIKGNEVIKIQKLEQTAFQLLHWFYKDPSCRFFLCTSKGTPVELKMDEKNQAQAIDRENERRKVEAPPRELIDYP